MTRLFLRAQARRYSKLGKNRKKLHKWRRPKGRHSKMRTHKKGHIQHPSLGLKKPVSSSGKIKNLTPILVHNIKELEQMTKDQIAIIAKIGTKKKLELIKKAQELRIKLFNVKEEKK